MKDDLVVAAEYLQAAVDGNVSADRSPPDR
jgi:hypothetical protein